MKILIHHHKYGDEYYDATDELWAFGEMFKALCEFEAYVDLEEPDADAVQKALHLSALEGNLKAAKKLCIRRRDYEYEGFSLGEVKVKPVSR
jgi:hypothetical protein